MCHTVGPGCFGHGRSVAAPHWLGEWERRSRCGRRGSPNGRPGPVRDAARVARRVPAPRRGARPGRRSERADRERAPAPPRRRRPVEGPGIRATSLLRPVRCARGGRARGAGTARAPRAGTFATAVSHRVRARRGSRLLRPSRRTSRCHLRRALLAAKALEPDGVRDHRLTDLGHALLDDLSLDGDRIQSSRRILARDCLDWTERRPHLAGALPAALLDRFIELGWLLRRRGDRGLLVTAVGVKSLANLGRDRTPHKPSVACVS